ncbi:MAG TPA: isoleucine--tRNA ligase, partial [Thermoplasmatales archaeon]|nr:isoleucine--tRNA ligase [Thermoplasmatales archaeon]
VVLADFVTMDEGTGIVHIAPAVGEDDYNVGRKYNLPVIQLVKPDGTFKDEVELWKGRFVKEADPDIIKYLEEKGLLEGVRNYSHEYPFCWRCGSPLLYYAMDSWFIAMSQVQQDLLDNNEQINWYPEHLKHGRFGDFIRDVKDWALSRDRYWGTPLPIWTCENKDCKYQICIGSVEELKDLAEDFPEEYDLHKPFVDELVVRCPKCNSRMKRESEVIDCWYDSGSAFFAQWHYPFENQELFKKSFPVDFICEALDQTRGWFYSLLAISTFLFNKPPYKNVLTLGLVLDKDNQKMSKSKRNYVDPMVILDNEGADALRWYLISANAPWNSTRFYEEAVKETLAKFILTLWNSYNFFATYAALDKFDPKKSIPIEKRTPLDRWILSRFHRMVKEIHGYMESFETHKAARVIEKFLLDDFSNWYLRRSRRRLWVEEETTEKLSGYSTMYEVFLGLVKTIAPFTPFIAEEIYQNLKTNDMPESVHLCDYVTVDEKLIDDELEIGMERIRDLVEVGRALRARIGIKVRYPLAEATLVCSKEVEDSIKDLLDLLVEEINVKNIRFDRNKDRFVTKQVKPKYPVLGPKLKEKMKQVSKVLEEMDKTSLYQQLMEEKEISIPVDGETITLTIDDFEIVEQEKENIAATETKDVILLLDTTLTPELEAEGFAREIIRRIQSMRKELDLNVDDKIKVEVEIPSEEKKNMVEQWKDYIAGETRAEKFDITTGSPRGDLVRKWSIDDITVSMGITSGGN